MHKNQILSWVALDWNEVHQESWKIIKKQSMTL